MCNFQKFNFSVKKCHLILVYCLFGQTQKCGVNLKRINFPLYYGIILYCNCFGCQHCDFVLGCVLFFFFLLSTQIQVPQKIIGICQVSYHITAFLVVIRMTFKSRNKLLSGNQKLFLFLAIKLLSGNQKLFLISAKKMQKNS